MQQATLDPQMLQQWVGNTQKTSSFIDQRSVDQMQSIIGYEQAPIVGDELPKLWHWMFTFPLAPLGALNEDGHPSNCGNSGNGGNADFMPPVALPKRMWAGGRVQFLHPLRVGQHMDCVSTIQKVELKKGRSGDLCFVTLLHEFRCEGKLCVVEEHDIVYKGGPVKGTSTGESRAEAKHKASWSTQIKPSSVMLFRYSAATFNSHRIHYDREYAQAEGYPGLVFHGPLTTTLLMKELQQRNPTKRVTQFNFKAITPLFDTETFSLNGTNVDDVGDSFAQLWAANAQGSLAIQARAKLE